jgi:hypothetical protein
MKKAQPLRLRPILKPGAEEGSSPDEKRIMILMGNLKKSAKFFPETHPLCTLFTGFAEG